MATPTDLDDVIAAYLACRENYRNGQANRLRLMHVLREAEVNCSALGKRLGELRREVVEAIRGGATRVAVELEDGPPDGFDVDQVIR